MILNLQQTEAFGYIERVKKLIAGKNKRACVITFGCQQNEADSEKIRGMALEMGYEISDTPENSDLIILNTCAIREHAEMKALSMLGLFKAQKKANPELIIGVAGCMPSQKGRAEQIKNDFHYVSFTVEPSMLHRIPELVFGAMTDKRRSFVFGEDEGDIVEGMPTLRRDGHRAWVSIMYGCNNFCSYCIVPYARGRERSRCSEEILRECRELVASGCREITLLGQNVNSYKSDINFAALLDRVANIEGDFIIRFMTSHPKDASDELIATMAKHSPKIAPYFHLPLQSGSTTVLRRMNRTYTREHFLELAYKLRDAIPGIALSTDVIIGFPGESEEDFNDTLDVLERVGFDNVYAFLYSPRVGTPAAKMTDQIPKEIKDARMARLLSLQDEIARQRNLPYVGTVQRVLIDSRSERDGMCSLNARTLSNKPVHLDSDTAQVGDLINVKITRAGAFDLFAEEIK